MWNMSRDAVLAADLTLLRDTTLIRFAEGVLSDG